MLAIYSVDIDFDNWQIFMLMHVPLKITNNWQEEKGNIEL